MTEPAPGREQFHALRRQFIGGSEARIIMGDDEAALVRLWREKRGEVEPEDLSANLVVQLGAVTEALNRRWYEANTGQVITDVQRQLRHPAIPWMAATLDGRVKGSGAVFEAKFMLPWSFSEEAAGEKYMPQLQHNMWVVAARTAVLSVITGGGKWVEIAAHADPLYQHLIVTAERKFWRCVESGEPPRLFGVEPPRPRIEAVRIVDMSSSNAWAEFAAIFARTRSAHFEHERSRTELKQAGARRRPASHRSRCPGEAVEIRRYQFRSPQCGGRPCSGPVNPSPRWLPRLPKLKSSSSIRKNHCLRPSSRLTEQIKRFGMRPCRAASTSCARPWDSTRSPPCRRPLSTRPLAWST